MKTEFEITFKVTVGEDAYTTSAGYQMAPEALMEAVRERVIGMVTREISYVPSAVFDPQTVMVTTIPPVPVMCVAPDADTVENVLADQ